MSRFNKLFGSRLICLSFGVVPCGLSLTTFGHCFTLGKFVGLFFVHLSTPTPTTVCLVFLPRQVCSHFYVGIPRSTRQSDLKK